MSSSAQTWERRRLNEEIEAAFITAAKAASNVEMKIFSGKGNIQGDLQDFYNQFNYLFRLTCNLKEMESKEGDALTERKGKVRTWMRQRVGNVGASQQMENIAKHGLDLFDEYYASLAHCGLITLPTRR